MDLYDIKWFNTEEKDDLEMIRDFVSRIPKNLEIILESGFYEHIEKKQINSLNKDTFSSAIKEMKGNIDLFLNTFYSRVYRKSVKIKLEYAGLRGANLLLKANALNYLWKKVVNKFKEIEKSITSLLDVRIIRNLNDLLKYLIVILGSLVSAFPMLESIKEFIELLDILISSSDDLKLCPLLV